MPNIASGKIQMEISETMRIDTFITQECDSSNDFDNRSAFQRFLCKGIAAFGFCMNQNRRVTYYRTTFPYFLHHHSFMVEKI